jgi:predicted small lipoprotein YifL
MLKVREILVSQGGRAARRVGFVAVALMLSSCGQKGPLYLPTAPEAKGRATLPQAVRPNFERAVVPGAAPASAAATDAPAAAPAASGTAR